MPKWITAAANYLEEIFSSCTFTLALNLTDVLVPCMESNIKIVFGASDEHRGFVKWEHNYIQNRRKTVF
jgi:hypothetical protein